VRGEIAPHLHSRVLSLSYSTVPGHTPLRVPLSIFAARFSSSAEYRLRVTEGACRSRREAAHASYHLGLTASRNVPSVSRAVESILASHHAARA
jgi:hypothetical protein